MYLEIEKHLPGFCDTISVFDEEGNTVFEIDSRIVLMKRSIRIFSADEEVVAIIERQDNIVEPAYNIYVEGQLVGELVKEFTFFEPRFHILSDFGPIITHGDILNLDFRLLDDEGNILAIISDDLCEEEDNYGIEINDEMDPIFIIALLIGIDVQLNEQ